MIYKLKVLIFLIFFLQSKKNDNFKIEIVVNNNHTSTVILKNNKLKIDSLIINDYYGKNKLTKISSTKWLFTYSDRCGTGCAIQNQIVLSFSNNKLNKTLHIPSNYLEFQTNKIKFKREFIIKEFSDKKLILKKTCSKNYKIYFSVVKKLNYDKIDQIYFNTKFTFKEKIYKGISIDSSDFIFYNKKWYEFDSKKLKSYEEI